MSEGGGVPTRGADRTRTVPGAAAATPPTNDRIRNFARAYCHQLFIPRSLSLGRELISHAAHITCAPSGAQKLLSAMALSAVRIYRTHTRLSLDFGACGEDSCVRVRESRRRGVTHVYVYGWRCDFV